MKLCDRCDKPQARTFAISSPAPAEHLAVERLLRGWGYCVCRPVENLGHLWVDHGGES